MSPSAEALLDNLLSDLSQLNDRSGAEAMADKHLQALQHGWPYAYIIGAPPYEECRTEIRTIVEQWQQKALDGEQLKTALAQWANEVSLFGEKMWETLVTVLADSLQSQSEVKGQGLE